MPTNLKSIPWADRPRRKILTPDFTPDPQRAAADALRYERRARHTRNQAHRDWLMEMADRCRRIGQRVVWS
jgi:hypothetical protein